MKFTAYDFDHVRWRSQSMRAEGTSTVQGGGISPAFLDNPETVGMYWEIGDLKQSKSLHISLDTQEARDLYQLLGEALDRWVGVTDTDTKDKT